MAGEAVGEHTREVIEERMDHRLKADEAARVLLGRVGRKRTEPPVLPEDVVAALGAVSDPEAPLLGYADEPAIAKQ